MVIHPYETLDSMRVHMTFERETKNTLRFAEDGATKTETSTDERGATDHGHRREARR